LPAESLRPIKDIKNQQLCLVLLQIKISGVIGLLGKWSEVVNCARSKDAFSRTLDSCFLSPKTTGLISILFQY
jgi:hypothetical protein